MYTVTVSRDFVAQHFLTVPDCGPENDRHSHHFRADVKLCGPQLNEYGYLVDIVDIEHVLDGLVERYRDRTLNELAEFEGLNPSIEHFARILTHSVVEAIEAETLETVTVKLWENEQAWAAYTYSF